MEWLYFWMFNLILFGTASQQLNLQCPEPKGWSFIFGRCVAPVPTRKSWLEAQKYCQSYGGKLAEPKGRQLLEEYATKAKQQNLQRVWIGFNKRNYFGIQNTIGFWSDGTNTTVGVGVWGDGQPDWETGKCVYVDIMGSSMSYWKWFAAPCDTLISSLCEYTPCVEGMYRCATTGRCVAQKNVCDREDDCGDNTDERDCSSKCAYYLYGESGEVRSPGYDGTSFYSPRSSCTWTIEGPIGTNIQLQFIDFATEKDVDVLEFWEGSPILTQSKSLGKFSGTSLSGAPSILSSNNFLIIRFSSDGSIQDRGFKIKWQTKFQCEIIQMKNSVFTESGGGQRTNVDPEECVADCSNAVTCTGISYNKLSRSCVFMTQVQKPVENICCDVYVKTCPNTASYPLLNETPKLDGTVVAESHAKVLYSPFYPLAYPGNTEMVWVITTSFMNIITLMVKNVQLGCEDLVVIRNGDNPLAPTLMTLTSSSTSGVFTMSTGSTMYIYMSLMSHLQYTGVLLQYNSGCHFEITANSGVIFSPGYGVTTYPGAQNCTTRITTTTGGPMRLYFRDFEVENNKDFLKVYKIRDSTITAVHTGSGYTGSIVPSDVTTNSGSLYLVFTTSAIGGRKGYIAEFTAGCSYIASSSVMVTPNSSEIFSPALLKAKCATGYIFQEPYYGQSDVYLRCLSNGSFDRTIPVCDQAFCGTVPIIPNGYIVSTTGVYGGDQVTYACESGYISSWPLTITCGSNGVWNTQPTCTASSCSPLSVAVANGRRDILVNDGIQHGSVLNYSCDSYYQLVGVPIIQCENGDWSSLPPVCHRIPCPDQYILNGTVDRSGGLYLADQVTVLCKTGFEVLGSSTYGCGVDIPPTCINIDECQRKTATCNQICEDTVGGYTCSCESGYKPTSWNSNICENINECTDSNALCDYWCRDTNGSYYCTCQTGKELYSFNGQNGLYLPSSQTGLEPHHQYYINHTCIDMMCPLPNLYILNGRALSQQTKFYYRYELTYLCNVGYFIEGTQFATKTIICQSDGTWTSQEPKCVLATCSLEIPKSSLVIPNTSINYGEYYELRCNQPNGDILFRRRFCSYNKTTTRYNTVGDREEIGFLCPVVDCGTPVAVKGAETYRYTCTQYGCSFQFTCRSVYTRAGHSSLGNSTIHCGADGRWDFGDLRCTDGLCNDPAYPPGSRQIATSYEEDSLVSFYCTRYGYATRDPYPIICKQVGDKLVWNSSDVRISHECIDVMPPTFDNCPVSNITVERFMAPNHVIPTARDNSGLVSTISVIPDNYLPTHKVADNTKVTYEAKDLRGNSRKCIFFIFIKDKCPPTLTCLGPQDFLIGQENTSITVDPERYVTAESGVQITSNTGVFTLGKNDIGRVVQVVIMATDTSGTSYCRLQITASAPKCQPWTLTSDNGVKNCSPKLGNLGYDCVFNCNDGFVFLEDINLHSVTVSCISGYDWNRGVPNCRRKTSSMYRQSFLLQYQTGALSNPSCTTEYKDQLTGRWEALSTSLQDLCRNSSSYAVNITKPSTKPLFKVSYDSGTTTDFLYVTVVFDITPRGFLDVAYTDCAAVIISAFMSGASAVNSIRTLSQTTDCPQSVSMNFIQTLDNAFICTSYEETQRNTSEGRTYCVNCPLGYYTRNNRECVACPAGTYLDIPSFDVCRACPAETNSKKLGLGRKEDCYLSCPLGMFSATGDAPCRECDLNQYSYDGITCKDCPPYTETLTRGSSNISDCLSYCQPGYYSYNGLEVPCTVCPKNYYQHYTKQTTCFSCGTSQITTNMASDSQSNCSDGFSTLCLPNPCGNSGSCSVVNHDFFCHCTTGYTGRTCDTFVNPCLSSPCFNGGQCTYTDNGSYKCTCSSRYNGTRCENDLDDCKGNQCKNGGACQDRDASYACLCPSYIGYSGSSCEIPRDPCAGNVCQNGGTCVAGGNIRHKCICKSGYTGDSCETDIDECASNPCANNGTCVDLENGYNCVCPTGYSGQFCQRRDDTATCRSGTCSGLTCVDLYLTNSATCLCNNGDIKENAQCVLKNYCKTNPCNNGGACLSEFGGYVCLCAQGYGGKNCEFNINECASRPCQNDGECTDANNGYQCKCNQAGTGGTNCADNVNECDSNPCDFGRSERCYDLINDFYCQCKEGYRGKTCSEGDIDCNSFPCLHGGTCNPSGTSYTCICPTGWTGTNCQQVVDACRSSPCQAGSTCINKIDSVTCVCQDSYRGNTCSTPYDLCRIANHCVRNNSICVTENGKPTCKCSACTGFTGSSCNLPLLSCETSTCQNGGTCSISEGQVTCSCVPGFTGSQCQTNIDDCASNTCPSNSNCLDGVNSRSCKCVDGKIGENCQKSFGYDFDFVIESYAERCNYSMDSSQRSTFPLGVTKLSMAFWLRYTNKTRTGPILTLYGLGTPLATPSVIFQIRRTVVTATISSQTLTLSYDNKDIADGYWHHITLTWNALSGQNVADQTGVVTLYVDGTVTGQKSDFGKGAKLPDFGWLVIGGEYSSSQQQINRNNGFIGRISRLYFTTTELNAVIDVSKLSSDLDLSYIPADVIHTPITNIMEEGYVHTDYRSQLTLSICRSSIDCTEPFDASNYPNVDVCPGDQMAVSQRVASPSWQEATFGNTRNTVYNIRSGETPMSWKLYGVYAAGFDEDGNAAVCTFLFFNHRVSCSQINPLSPTYGAMSCDPVTDGKSCAAVCDSQRQLTVPGPNYYTCSMYDHFDSYDRVEPFSFPACSETVFKKQNLILTIDYTFSESCQKGRQSLKSNLQNTLSTLNSLWTFGLCATQDCGSVNVNVTCSSESAKKGTVQFEFNMIQDPLISTADSTITTNMADLLMVEVIDMKAIDYFGMEALMSTMDIQIVPTCPDNQMLIGDYCVQCGVGTYYDRSLQKCELCRKGTYQDQAGQLSCKQCRSGTTYQAGAQSDSDCKDSCSEGRYYSLNLRQCIACPLGFFQSAVGTFHCDPCSIDKTTEYKQATSITDCGDFSAATKTPPGDLSGVGESKTMTGEEEMSAAVIIAIIIGIIIFIIVILALLFFLCRDRVQCLAKKEILPEGDTPWKYVNRYGETNLKFVNYKLRDIRDRRHRKRGDHQPIVMNKMDKYYDPNESQSIHSEEVVANNNNEMFVYETIDSMPQEQAPRSHVIEDEYTQVPRKKGKRGKKKRKRLSPEREPKALPALQDRGFRSKAPPIDGGSHRQRNVDDDSYYVRQSTPRGDHMQIDSGDEYR